MFEAKLFEFFNPCIKFKFEMKLSHNFLFYSTSAPEYVLMWLNFILGLNFIFLLFQTHYQHYHTPKQKKIKFKPRIKFKHNICTH